MLRKKWGARLGCVALVASMAACGSDNPPTGGAVGSASAIGSASGSAATPNAPPVKGAALHVYEGAALARNAAETFVVVADEDHDALRVVSLPLTDKSAVRTLSMPGPPAQVLMLPGRVLITVRQPSLLMAFDTGGTPDNPSTWSEVYKTPLPNDAWGLAVDQAQKNAYVSSAWGRRVSAVNIADGKKRWSAEVAKEPRGLLVRGDALFVNHLVGSDITRISSLASEAPKVERREIWPDPTHSPLGTTPQGALGYALAASPDDRRLFVARHAIGALGPWAWYGSATVDVYDMKLDRALLGKPKYRRKTNLADFAPAGLRGDKEGLTEYWKDMSRKTDATQVKGGPVALGAVAMHQPRHIVYRKTTDTVLVASEGQNEVMELDALGPAPALAPFSSYKLGYEEKVILQYPIKSGAPSGIALSKNEATAYVYCRSTDDLVAEPLDVARYDRKRFDGTDAAAAAEADRKSIAVRLVDPSLHSDPKDKTVELRQIGRAAFYQGASNRIGNGAACASCHPEGREDGFVWREVKQMQEKEEQVRLVSDTRLAVAADTPDSFWYRRADEPFNDTGGARQTPMLAGRVGHAGPFGWLSESETLQKRILHGMDLHRPINGWRDDDKNPVLGYLAEALSRHLRKGLRPPARDERELTELEQKGRALFMSPGTRCASCHDPKASYTDGTGYPKVVSAKKAFRDETKTRFRTPSLLFVGHTEPYFHDGSRSTLASLIDHNNDKMGKTNQLTADERKALVAFLETL